MPWPPTSTTDLPIPLADQLAAGTASGLDSTVAAGLDGTSGQDPTNGSVAPGILSMQSDPLDLVSDLELLRKKQRTTLEGAPDKKRQAVIDAALAKLGWKYVWGGESDAEGGYDCSGLLFYAFRQAGIDMPRVSMAQAERGKRVGLTELQPGDLVAFENRAAQAGADHIALYLGDGWILEAPYTGAVVRKRKLTGKERNAWGVHLDY